MMREPCYAPILEPRSGFDCFLRSILLILTVILLILFSWVPSIHCRLLQALFELRVCRRGNRDPNIDLHFDPNEWLTRQQLVGAAVVWQEINGALLPHARWSAAQKRDLYNAYWKARLDEETEIPSAPEEARPESVGRYEGTWYPPGLAWRIFIAHVAQSLAVQNAGWVPWSITSYSAEQLTMLLDSRSLFVLDAAYRTGRYVIDKRVHGIVSPGDPVRTFRFLRGLSPSGATSRVIIEHLLGWCRANLVHFLNTITIENCLNHWQYSGYPPVERMISGTVRVRPADSGHFTAGCHGTVGFLRAVLRTINLPVARVEACRHSLPHFVRDDLFLSHGDDPYSRSAFSSPLPPAGEMLISRRTYDEWFGPAVSSERQCANVGRRMVELSLANPNSAYLLWTRCQDIARGRPNADSDIYAVFSSTYALAELEASGLWRRLDEEIARRGGCSAIPVG